MPTLVLDKVRDAELVGASDGIYSYVRYGHIDNIDVASDNDPDALVKVLPYLPTWGTSLGPSSPAMKLRQVRIKPEPAKVRRANLWLTYDNATNLTPTAYLLRDRTYTIETETYWIPGTRQEVVVGFDVDLSLDYTKYLWAAKKPLLFRCSVAARAIQLTMLQYGRPSGGAQNYVNCVNDAAWPTGGATLNGIAQPTAGQLGKGYWRLSQYATEMNRQTGMTLVQAEAVTKVIEDWSEYAMLRNEKDGSYPFATMKPADRNTIRNAILSRAYENAMIYPKNTDNHTGIARFGPYPLATFSSIFGFIWPLMLMLSLFAGMSR